MIPRATAHPVTGLAMPSGGALDGRLGFDIDDWRHRGRDAGKARVRETRAPRSPGVSLSPSRPMLAPTIQVRSLRFQPSSPAPSFRRLRHAAAH